MFKSLSAFSKHVIGELFQTYCYFCHRRTDEAICCETCAVFSEVKPPNCLRCGISLPMEMRECLDCVMIVQQSSLHEIKSHFWLEERSKELLYLAKYKKEPMYLKVFRRPKFNLPKNFGGEIAIIPVPLTFEKYLDRTYNQSSVLANWIAKTTGSRLLCEGLLKVNETRSQTMLSKNDRQKNLKRSFRWNEACQKPANVLLVDDVMTTGATLEECARTLQKVGIKKVSAWTLFRTPKER